MEKIVYDADSRSFRIVIDCSAMSPVKRVLNLVRTKMENTDDTQLETFQTVDETQSADEPQTVDTAQAVDAPQSVDEGTQTEYSSLNDVRERQTLPDGSIEHYEDEPRSTEREYKVVNGILYECTAEETAAIRDQWATAKAEMNSPENLIKQELTRLKSFCSQISSDLEIYIAGQRPSIDKLLYIGTNHLPLKVMLVQGAWETAKAFSDSIEVNDLFTQADKDALLSLFDKHNPYA